MTSSSKSSPSPIKARNCGDLGAEEILDELRVLIRDKMGTTAFFCFSTQIKELNQLRIYGPTDSIVVDHRHWKPQSETRNRSYKSYLTYFIPPLKTAREHFRNARSQHDKFSAPDGSTRTSE